MNISHKDIEQFAENKVNLPPEHAKKYREQLKRLSDKLKAHNEENPDYRLKRIMSSGSLAKRTSLRSISDADMVLYIKTDEDRQNTTELLTWLVEELRTLYPQKKDDITVKNYSVSIDFKGAGLDVDVVPIHLLSDDWDGDLVSQYDGSHLKTNIPQHLEFMKERHKKHGPGFRQVIRLLKYWANEQKESNENFRFKSFMIELIVAHLVNEKNRHHISLNDYPTALREFFDYLQMENLDEVISFDDFGNGAVQKQGTPINIFDPVNAENNVADQYTQGNKDLILDAAMDAADAIEYAACATTKEEAVRQWRRVFGSSFVI